MRYCICLDIKDNQFGFRPGMATTKPVCGMRQLQNKCLGKTMNIRVDLKRHTMELQGI